ncbi:branched-chain amino acid ABC transporter permease [Chloroflexota bacterium]
MSHLPCGNFKSNYIEDEGIFPTSFLKIATITCFVLLIALPWLLSGYLVYMAILILIAVIGALGINIITGYAGQISLGHGAFIGVGAYTCGILATKAGMPFWVTLPAAGVMAAIAGVTFGLPSLRLKGLYLAMATLAAQLLLADYLFIRLDWLTGGAAAMLVDRPDVFGFQLRDDRSFYYLVLVVVVAAVFFTINLFRTKTGRAFVAIKDRDIAAELIGINLFRYKLLAFGTGSFYAGVAGALTAYFWTVISPEAFGLTVSIQYLAMIIVGGLGSVRGSIFGAIFIILLPQVTKNLVQAVAPIIPPAIPIANIFPALELMLFGLVIILFLILEPEGLNRMWRNLRAYITLWPFPY